MSRQTGPNPRTNSERRRLAFRRDENSIPGECRRFGPEYGQTVDELGSQTNAESELKAHEKRVECLDIGPLAP
jgi:hypothetical protein